MNNFRIKYYWIAAKSIQQIELELVSVGLIDTFNQIDQFENITFY